MLRRRIKRAIRRLLPFVLVASLVFGVMVAHTMLFATVSGQGVELRQTDLWLRLRGAIPAPKELVIVSIDENTYREL